MTTYYVSSEIGSNNNAGTSATVPLATLQAAAGLVKPGDTVEVMNGTYTTGGNGDVVDITTSGTASAPITFEAAPGQTPVINSTGSWNAINVEASYIVINGFTVVGDAANYTLAQALAGYSTGNPNLDGNGIVVSTPGNGVVPNHITIENNTVYNEPGGGIGVGNADYVQILNNVVYDNAHWSAFGTSGISVAVSQNSDTNPGVHDIISGNIVFGNAQLVPTNTGGGITDGEGIILDTNPGFVGEILIENNTVYGNGSSGIESFLTDNAVITGNTVYGNDTGNVQPASDAEILINQSNNNTVTNNTTTAPGLTPPAAPVISGDTVNYGNTVTLNGTAEVGSTITVFDNSTQLGTTVTNGSGAWTFTTGALANGSESFTATATDSVGNVSPLSSALVMTLNGPVNLVANGNFATGDLTDWTLGGNYTSGQIFIDPNAEGGSTYAAGMGSMGADGTLSQTIATTAGQTYTLSFWLQNEGSGGNDFKAIWNGQTLLSLTNAGQSGYTEYTYTVTATGSTTPLEFSAANGPSQWDLDNISLTANGTSTPPPAAPVISTGVANSNETVKLTGTALDGSTVTVSDGGATALGTATASSSTGAWSFTTAALAAGSYAFTATDTTSAGTSAASSAFDVTVPDPPPPAAPVISTGVANSNETVKLTGTALDGSTVTVSDGGATALGTATASSSTGAWSFTTAALAAGSYAFTATDTTSAGTSAASSAFDVTVPDPPPPAAPVISTGVANSNETVKLTGTALDGSTVTVSDGGATALGTATASSSTGAWSFTTAALAAGSYAFTATDTTSAGTSAASSAFDVTVPDPPPPAAPVISTGVANSNETVKLTGTALDGSTVTVSDGGATALGTATASSSTGAWSFTTAALAAGSYAFTATDTTSAGTSAASSAFDVTVPDPPPPAAPVISTGVANSNETVKLTGTALDGSTVTVSDGGATALGTATASSSTGAWSFTTAALAAGSYAFTATDTTSAGTSAASGAFDVSVPDPPPPAAPVISTGVANSNETVKLTGTAPDGSTVTVSDGGATALGTATASSSTGAWSFTTAALAAGSYAFTATDTTSAGTSAASSAFDVSVPDPPPSSSNLVANGNFATGNFTDWTLGGNYTSTTVGPEVFIDTIAQGGSTYAAGMGSVGADGTLSQTIATTAGQTYTLSFSLQNDASGANDFKAIWNGQKLLSLTNAAQFGYREYTYIVTATGNTTTLEFSAANGPSQWDLDNISLTANSTPPPAAPVISTGVENSNESVTLTGTAPDGSTVTVSDGGAKALGTATASSTGAWSFTTAHLSAGSYAFTATDTASAGNVSTASSPLNVKVNANLIGAVTIGTGATLELVAADSGSVAFSSSTGTLILDEPSTFSGKIFNFTGNGKLSGSDQIDLKGINYNSVHDSYANGVLTVTDGTDTVKLGFNGSYKLANFDFVSDGSGGTIVYDPPVPTSNALVPTSSGQTVTACEPQTGGSATIGTGATLELGGACSEAVTFSGPTGTLVLGSSSTSGGQSSNFTGTVSGFGAQNVIDIPGMPFDAKTTLGYLPDSNGGGGTLLLSDGALNAKIALLGNYMASSFAMASDNNGGTMLVAETMQSGNHALLANPH